MTLVGVELETLVFEPDALTAQPPQCNLTILVFHNVFPNNSRLEISATKLHYKSHLLWE